MNKCISQNTIVPVRKEPDERSEMINQLLFGELAEIIEIRGSWSKISLFHDNYTGWVDHKMITPLSDLEFDEFRKIPSIVLKENYAELLLKDQSVMIIVKGSVIPIENNSGTFAIASRSYILSGNINKSFPVKTMESIIKTAKEYLNTPYLWGGRSPFGIDCSGFSQMVYKLHDINIPRDASEQFESGISIHSLADSLPGDLAFFQNEKGTIHHVGILLSKNEIIHSSGKVRINRIDEKGILKDETDNYSHRLKAIKRIVI